ncbi:MULTISPECIES: hypothetical protein [Nostocales]|uniref:Uncharacterized protein n=3 Tax=Nostocales TaxID=1161 RepID=A0A8S9SXJ6_9CYAN|nr:hypothetical protein [Tolypothrix bouteillei]KAF3884467.1 hypothetical protein DA73_0400002520 [Tolypothrix bouteillei VB521301]
MISFNQNFRYFVYLALLAILLGVVAEFDGAITVQVAPWSLQVKVQGGSSPCSNDLVPPESQLNVLKRKLA